MSGHEREVVVLLHGGSAGRSPWSENHATWDQTCSHLEQAGFLCVAVDRPGHGALEARVLDDMTFEAECASVAEVIRAHGGRAHLVGHAEAGVTALLLAQRTMQEKFGVAVRSCTVVGGFGAEPTGDAPERMVLASPPVPEWSSASQRWALRRLSYLGDNFGDQCDDVTATKSSLAAARILAESGAQARVASDLLRAKSEIFAYARDYGYDVPISLTWGMEDPLSEPVRALELMNLLATTRSHLELNLVDRAGHFVHREQPDEFVRLLEGFLTGGSQE